MIEDFIEGLSPTHSLDGPETDHKRIMETVSLFQDDQDKGHLGSGLKLRSFLNEGLHQPPEQNRPTVGGDADAHSKVELMKNDADADILLISEERAESRIKDGKNSDGSESRGVAIEGGHALHSAEENTAMGDRCAREDLDDIDATDMCFEGCDITGHSKSNSSKQETPLEYGDTYLEDSLGERDGMLIESVPASSPASFFQSDTIHVSGDKSLVGRTDTWRDIRSSQQESDYHRSSSEFDLTEQRAGDSIFPKEATNDTLANNETSNERGVLKDTPFNSMPTPGLTNAENCQSSKGYMENMNHSEQKNTSRGSLLKEKMPLVNLCLRSVLCDPMTGAFLDDAMVAQCGHSFGGGSLEKVMETHVCMACGATISPQSLVPNFALRVAVLAYKHEDQLQMSSIRGLKRRREAFEQVEGSEAKMTERDHWGSAETTSADNSRLKSVQFPFVVNDKVLIKQGNKRTPERFVGREAIITTQCLNGWYLVKLLDTGESVRLQYRSLEKLGDVEMPYTSAMEYFSDQCGDQSPFELPQGPTKATADTGLESGSPASQRDAANGMLGYPDQEKKTNSSGSSERDLLRLPYSSSALRDGSQVSNSISVMANTSAEDLPGSQGRNIEHRMGCLEEGPKISESSRDQHPIMERCSAAVGQSVSDAMVEKFRTDLLNGISTFHDESGDEQMAQDGSQSETSAKLWVGSKIDFLDTHTLNGEHVSPSRILSTDPAGDATGAGDPTGNKDQDNENELLKIRSRRASVHSRNSLPVGVCGQDSDPYRKVYSSGYRRRGGKGDTVVTMIPEDLLAENKSNDNVQGSVKRPSEGLNGGVSGGRMHGKGTKVKSTTEILQIMRKDMLKLEKQIPRSYLLSSWRSDRISWRKGVRASRTVLELGYLLREFRYALLLTTAGGITDEELEKRLTKINESGDVDLLVSLWGRFYDDVCKVVESKPKGGSNLAHSAWRRLLTVQAKDVQDLDLSLSGQSVFPGQMTTAVTTADAVGDCQQTSGSEFKTLLASTMTLLQKQSRMELMSVKEALEREKRHIMAKLANLEESYVKLGSSPPVENSSTSAKPSGEGLNGQPSQLFTAVPSNNKLSSGGSPSISAPGDETDDGESIRASPSQDADGEATDMSDSD